MSPRILVTGAGGMLGQAVLRAGEAAGHELFGFTRAELDITDGVQVTQLLAEHHAHAVINCAAYTDVDGAESDEATALAINGLGAENLAKAADRTGTRLVHVSTDYVFAGDDPSPRRETDPAGPKTAYGRTKLAGEEAILAYGDDYAIARTAWLFGAGGSNFVDTMLKLGAERDTLQVVDDQVGCPTWTGHLAPALIELAAGTAYGITHLAGDGQASWFKLASEAIAKAGLGATVEPVDSSAFQRPAPRPAWSILGSTRADAPRLPAWDVGLSAYLAESGRLVTPDPGSAATS